MAIQQNGSLVRALADGSWIIAAKATCANATTGAWTINEGNAWISSISSNSNANVAVVTCKFSVIVAQSVDGQFRDDGGKGISVSAGNVQNEGTTSNLVFNINKLAAGGTSTTFSNNDVISIQVQIRNTSSQPGA